MDTLPLVRKAIESLNEAFKADPKAVWTLMNAYTPCNEALADHPTVQVISKEVEGKETFTVGPLGLINGVVEAALGHRICIMTSDENEKGQRTLLGFDIYKAPVEAPSVEDENARLVRESPLV